MYIHQISVFIENKPGNLAALTNYLADNNVDLRALEIAETTDYGIIRLIVDDPFMTLTLLKDNGWVCKMTPVIGVKIPDTPGSMAKIMNILADAGVSLDYVYAFLSRVVGTALLVLRVEDNDAVAAILKKNGVELVDQNNLS